MLKKALYYSYFFILALPLFILATILAATIAIVGCSLGGAKVFAYYPGVIWSRIALFLFLCPVRLEGREHLKGLNKATIIMPNHQSALDIFLVYGYLGLPFRFMLKESLRKVPFIGKFCQVAGFVFVDERKPTSVKASMEQARKLLAEGNSLLLFPEGHRTKTGDLMPLRRGGFRLAHQLKSTILPVALSYSYEALPYGKKIPWPHRLIVRVLPPISPQEKADNDQAIATLQETVYNSLAEAIERDR